MTCDYKKYPANWKTEIRPDILFRDWWSCKFCKVGNGDLIFRGYLNGVEVYQDSEGDIYNAANGEFIVCDVRKSITPISGNPKQKAIKIVLTIMHLDHDISNNDYSNLAAACQKCHLNYDKDHHKKNARETRNKKKKLQSLFVSDVQ